MQYASPVPFAESCESTEERVITVARGNSSTHLKDQQFTTQSYKATRANPRELPNFVVSSSPRRQDPEHDDAQPTQTSPCGREMSRLPPFRLRREFDVLFKCLVCCRYIEGRVKRAHECDVVCLINVNMKCVAPINLNISNVPTGDAR